MIGIKSYGSYVPFNRLTRKAIADVYGKKAGAGEKAVANYDEDSITMAVAAALDCVRGFDVKTIGGCYFASTTAPYLEKACAGVVAAAVDLKKELRSADFSGTLRCGSSALMAALDLASTGKDCLVSVADTRLGAADGANEMNFGDAAAAFLVGSDKVIAEVNAYKTYTQDFQDLWRDKDDKYVRSWEDRFPLTEFYNKIIPEAVADVMKDLSLTAKDFSKLVIYSHVQRSQAAIAKMLGFAPEQIQDGNYATIGNSGAAFAPIMLAGALETAKPGDRILYVGYGEGVDVIALTVTEEIEKMQYRSSLAYWVNRKKNTMNYEKYLRWKGLLYFEPARRRKTERSSLPEYYRVPKKNLSLYGSVCKTCGTPQYPPTKICVNCGSRELDEYPFYGKRGVIKTFTADYLAESQDPPNISVVVDFDGGGRMFTLLMDADLEKVAVGKEVDMTFRCMQVVDGIHTYFWKAVLKD